MLSSKETCLSTTTTITAASNNNIWSDLGLPSSWITVFSFAARHFPCPFKMDDCFRYPWKSFSLLYILSRVMLVTIDGVGLTTGFIGLHTVTHNYSVPTTVDLHTRLHFTVFNGNGSSACVPLHCLGSVSPGPRTSCRPDSSSLTGSHWPSTNSSLLYGRLPSGLTAFSQLTPNWTETGSLKTLVI
jgi:hypothetical protein